MTNEEKAKQILDNHNKLGIIKPNSIGEKFTINVIVDALNQKDQQFKEYLEKEQSELDGTRNKSNYELLDEIINELFKEEKK